MLIQFVSLPTEVHKTEYDHIVCFTAMLVREGYWISGRIYFHPNAFFTNVLKHWLRSCLILCVSSVHTYAPQWSGCRSPWVELFRWWNKTFCGRSSLSKIDLISLSLRHTIKMTSIIFQERIKWLHDMVNNRGAKDKRFYLKSAMPIYYSLKQIKMRKTNTAFQLNLQFNWNE